MYLSAQYGRSAPRGYYYLGGRAASKARRSSLRYLSALTPDQATEQIFPAASVKTSAGHNQGVRNGILASVQAGQITGNTPGVLDYTPGTGECSASGVSTTVKLAQTASGLALTGTTIGLTAAGTFTAAALAPWTLGISAIIGLFPIIFGHHAAAVKKEQSVLCAAVPAANNYLQIIDQAVQSGQATPQQGQSALDSLVSDFQSQVASIIHGADPMSSGECNAACVELSKLRAIVAYKKSVYQDMAASSAASPVSSVTAAIQQATASAGLPSWLPYAVGGFLLWKFVS